MAEKRFTPEEIGERVELLTTMFARAYEEDGDETGGQHVETVIELADEDLPRSLINVAKAAGYTRSSISNND